jgi:hypothetical protein
MTQKIELSVLDPSPIVEGGSADFPFKHTLDLAKKTEQWGYKRFGMLNIIIGQEWRVQHPRS